MHILYISHKKNWAGIVSWMQNTALNLQLRGHKVWILSHKDSALTKNANEDIFLIPKNLGMDFNPFMIIWLVFFIIKHKIDLVVTNITKEVLIGGLAAKITGIPNIRRIGTEKDFDNPKMKKFYNLIDYIIAPCKYMVAYILKNKKFVKGNQITHVYNGRDTKKFTTTDIMCFKRKYKVPLRKLIIGITCQFSETKNICGVLDVFKKLLKENENIHLVLAGDGPRKNKIKARIQELRLQDSVTLTGFIRNTLQVAAIYDVGVLFSYMEGFSNSVVEYMSAGTPVVCTNVGGQYEIVKNNYNGFLIEPGNKEQLYEKLSYLLNNKKERLIFSHNALKTIQNKFSENHMMDKLEEIYSVYATE